MPLGLSHEWFPHETLCEWILMHFECEDFSLELVHRDSTPINSITIIWKHQFLEWLSLQQQFQPVNKSHVAHFSKCIRTTGGEQKTHRIPSPNRMSQSTKINYVTRVIVARVRCKRFAPWVSSSTSIRFKNHCWWNNNGWMIWEIFWHFLFPLNYFWCLFWLFIQ